MTMYQVSDRKQEGVVTWDADDARKWATDFSAGVQALKNVQPLGTWLLKVVVLHTC